MVGTLPPVKTSKPTQIEIAKTIHHVLGYQALAQTYIHTNFWRRFWFPACASH